MFNLSFSSNRCFPWLISIWRKFKTCFQGDLPSRRLHARLNAGEIPNLVSRESTFSCSVSRCYFWAILLIFSIFLNFTNSVYSVNFSKCITETCLSAWYLLSFCSYLVMPFVAQDLSHIMKKKRLSSNIITYLFYQLMRGLKVRNS